MKLSDIESLKAHMRGEKDKVRILSNGLHPQRYKADEVERIVIAYEIFLKKERIKWANRRR